MSDSLRFNDGPPNGGRYLPSLVGPPKGGHYGVAGKPGGPS